MAPATSTLLPVTILAGPSAHRLVRDLLSGEPGRRLGLLASSPFDSQSMDNRLVVEPLVMANGGGYEPGRIAAQISGVAEKASVDHLLIECDSKTHPIAFASLFLPDGPGGESLSRVARLCFVGVAIDSGSLINSIVNGDQVHGVTSPCILADQIECADTIVLSDGESSEKCFMLARAVLSALNPRANLIEATRKMTLSGLLDDRSSLDFEAAFAGAGWRKLMEEEPGGRRVDDQGVMTFPYRARRPFHPQKFWNLLQSPFPGVFRAKGFFWLATRMRIVGGLNIADSERHYSPAGEWWAAVVHDDGSERPEIPDRLKKEWMEPFGDRRQAIAFAGIDVDFADLSSQLDACLLTDAEMASGEHAWAKLPDPFPAWSTDSHSHDCEEHGCCNH